MKLLGFVKAVYPHQSQMKEHLKRHQVAILTHLIKLKRFQSTAHHNQLLVQISLLDFLVFIPKNQILVQVKNLYELVKHICIFIKPGYKKTSFSDFASFFQHKVQAEFQSWL